MGIIAPPISIRRIDTDREDAFALEISGPLTDADVENAYGLLEGAYELHDKIDLLVRVIDQEGVDWSTTERESTLFATARASKHIRRFAVVGPTSWITAMAGIFEPSTPAEMKHFEAKEEAEAWAWIGVSEIPENI